MANRGRGRPTKLTPEVQERICQGVALGMRYDRAAVAAGVSERVFYDWKARGEAEDSGIYCEFLQALNEAETRGERRLLAKIESHGVNDNPGKWQALAWILERRHRNLYGPTKAVETPRTAPASITYRWAESAEEAGVELPDDDE